MEATRKERTLAAPAAVKGWILERAGRSRRVPAGAAGSGIVFVRRDLRGCPRIPAAMTSRRDPPPHGARRGRASVEMVEHLMAALAGLQIDNCEVWVDQPEMPGCDGSSLPFVEAFGRGTSSRTPLRRRHVDPPADPPGK